MSPIQPTFESAYHLHPQPDDSRTIIEFVCEGSSRVKTATHNSEFNPSHLSCTYPPQSCQTDHKITIPHCNKAFFFLENSRNFLDNAKVFLNLNCAHFSCRCLAIIPDAHMNHYRRDWFRAYQKTDNSVPIQECTFQSVAAHRLYLGPDPH